MKKKILAALCAICTCVTSYTVSFLPTASADDDMLSGTYLNYLRLDTGNTGNIYFGLDNAITFNLKAKNKTNAKIGVRYKYNIKDESGAEIYNTEDGPATQFDASGFTNWVQLNANAMGTLPIPLPQDDVINKYGIYTLNLTVRSGPSTTVTEDKTLSSEFSVCIPAGNVQNEGFGFNQKYFNPGSSDVAIADANALLPLMQNNGAKWHREDILWGVIEPVEKQYISLGDKDDPNPNTVYNRIANLKSQEINTVCILKGTNLLYDNNEEFPNQGTPESETAVKAFAAFCAYVASQLGDVVDHYEIWNEWNVETFNPAKLPPSAYANLLKESYKAIKKVDSTSTVIGCDCAGIPSQENGWIDRVLRALQARGGDPATNHYFMDALSVHSYYYNPEGNPATEGFPEQQLEDKVSDLKDLLTDVYNLQDMPLWLTEFGFNTYKNETATGGNDDGSNAVACSQAEQLNAIVMFEVFNKARGWFNKTILYGLSNRGTDEYAIQQNWGVLHSWQQKRIIIAPESGIDAKFIPKSAAKSAYLGLSAMNYFIGNATYDSDAPYSIVLEDQTNRNYAYKFTNSTLGKYVTVALAGGIENTSTINLDIGSNSIEIYDKYGNHVNTMESTTGQYSLPVSSEPIYILSDIAQQ